MSREFVMVRITPGTWVSPADISAVCGCGCYTAVILRNGETLRINNQTVGEVMKTIKDALRGEWK